jgi:predicted CXXCH cytochrome family protein
MESMKVKLFIPMLSISLSLILSCMTNEFNPPSQSHSPPNPQRILVSQTPPDLSPALASQPSPDPSLALASQPSPAAQSAPVSETSSVSRTSAEFLHGPYAQEDCLACHFSDKPNDKDLNDETPGMCYNCHDEHTKSFVHGVVSMGECLVCHDPHGSDNDLFLKQEIPGLCYSCHDRVQKIMTDPERVKHPPASDQCIACHSPHESDSSSKFLKQDLETLCATCHDESNSPMQNYGSDVAYKHKPAKDKQCGQCHDPHSSPFEFHLIEESMDLCLKCHNKRVMAYDGKVLKNIEQSLKNNPIWHGPLNEGNCNGCHNPHGSNNFRILKDTYPQEFYTSDFSINNYGLCFSCHEAEILKDKETLTLTNFRVGKRNMHFMHVTNDKKGRSCRACHETHASNQPKHIRESVPFGKIGWPIKLKYEIDSADVNSGKPGDAHTATPVKTGGSCVGCHKRRHYDYSIND